MHKRSQQQDVARCLAGLFLLFLASNSAAAGPATEARITQVVNEVVLLAGDGASRPALLNEKIHTGMILRTGADSRAELTFTDQTVVRFAANTAVNITEGTANLTLSEGAVLLQVPKRAKGVKIHAANVAAAVTGTTVMFEHHPGVYKLLVLEGAGRLYRPGHLGDSILVPAGQMVIGNPSSPVSDPVDVDIGRFVKTSQFIVDFPPLRNEASLVSESQKQQRQKSKKMLLDTNLVIFGGGTQVSLVDPNPTQASDQPRPTRTAAESSSASSPTVDAAPAPRANSSPEMEKTKRR